MYRYYNYYPLCSLETMPIRVRKEKMFSFIIKLNFLIMKFLNNYSPNRANIFTILVGESGENDNVIELEIDKSFWGTAVVA